jgi:hypothetical protein
MAVTGQKTRSVFKLALHREAFHEAIEVVPLLHIVERRVKRVAEQQEHALGFLVNASSGKHSASDGSCLHGIGASLQAGRGARDGGGHG